MRNNIIIIIALILVSCSDNSTDSGAPYSGEWFRQYVVWENKNLLSELELDSMYTSNTIFKTEFKVIGDMYLQEIDTSIELIMPNLEEIVESSSYYKEKYKIRFNTNNDSNSFNLETNVRINEDYHKSNIEGHYYSCYLFIDSIYIDKDTLYPTSLGADSLKYAFVVPEKRWYVKGQQMYDSINSRSVTDLEYLEEFFISFYSRINFNHRDLYNGKLRLIRD